MSTDTEFREEVLQRITKLESQLYSLEEKLDADMKALKEAMERVSQHSNHDITALNECIYKEQQEIKEILSEITKLKLCNVKNTMVDKVLIVLGTGILIGGITLGFDLLGNYLSNIILLI